VRGEYVEHSHLVVLSVIVLVVIRVVELCVVAIHDRLISPILLTLAVVPFVPTARIVFAGLPAGLCPTCLAHACLLSRKGGHPVVTPRIVYLGHQAFDGSDYVWIKIKHDVEVIAQLEQVVVVLRRWYVRLFRRILNCTHICERTLEVVVQRHGAGCATVWVWVPVVWLLDLALDLELIRHEGDVRDQVFHHVGQCVVKHCLACRKKYESLILGRDDFLVVGLEP